MIKCAHYLFAVLGLLVFSSLPSPADLAPAPADATATPARAAAKPVFLTGDEKIWSDFPKAPVAGSDVDKADLKEVLAAQASRTPEQKDQAMKDKHYVVTLVPDAISPDFRTKYPQTFIVLSEADQDCAVITTKLKTANGRPRPYENHKEVQPLFTSAGLNMSYPSGHSSGAEVQAKILATLFKANGQDVLVLKRAQQVADGRVIAGVHYPSDIRAGIALGDLIFAQLEANPKFVAALAAAAKADGITE